MNIVLNSFLIPRFGFVGAAIATVATEILIFGLHYAIRPVRIPVLGTGKVVFASCVMAASLWFIPVLWWYKVLIGVALYPLLLVVIRSATPDELRVLRQIFRRD